jgi:hypothetical protein
MDKKSIWGEGEFIDNLLNIHLPKVRGLDTSLLYIKPKQLHVEIPAPPRRCKRPWFQLIRVVSIFFLETFGDYLLEH